MSIKGMTNRGERGVNLPEIGRIRKGAAKGEKGQIGKNLQHFRFDFDLHVAAECDAIVDALYTKEPNNISVYLPLASTNRLTDPRTGEVLKKGDERGEYDNPNWSAWLECWKAGGLLYRSDGERVQFLRDPDTWETKVSNWQPDTPCATLTKTPIYSYTSKKNDVVPVYPAYSGRLRVLLLDLKRFAYLTFVTTSSHDCRNISQQLNAYIEMAPGGNLQGVPFILGRRPIVIGKPIGDGGKPVRSEEWLVYLETDPSYVAARIEAQRKAAFQLPAPAVVEGVFEELPGIDEEPEWTIPGYGDSGKVEEEPIPDVFKEEPSQAPAPSAGQAETAMDAVERIDKESQNNADAKPAAAPEEEKPEAPGSGKRGNFSLTLLVDIVERKFAPDKSEAAKMLGRSPWLWKANSIKARGPIYQWCKLFRGKIDDGMPPDDAAGDATINVQQLMETELKFE